MPLYSDSLLFCFSACAPTDEMNRQCPEYRKKRDRAIAERLGAWMLFAPRPVAAVAVAETKKKPFPTTKKKMSFSGRPRPRPPPLRAPLRAHTGPRFSDGPSRADAPGRLAQGARRQGRQRRGDDDGGQGGAAGRRRRRRVFLLETKCPRESRELLLLLRWLRLRASPRPRRRSTRTGSRR